MNERFESTNIKEIEEALKHFNRFHDDCVAGIEIKFEDYKALDKNGAAIGIGSANKTIILIVNTDPYKKEHNKFIRVEFKDVKSFFISSPLQNDGPKAGPTWGISDTYIELVPDDIDIDWEFSFICGWAKFSIICSKIVISHETDAKYAQTTNNEALKLIRGPARES
jgi:hypothetical protein